MRRTAALVLASLGALGCTDTLPPQGQVLLYIDTDTVLPAATDPRPPLFDRLRVDLFDAGATEPCAGCSRELPIDRDIVAAADASIGIVPEPGREGIVARVRLYRGGGTISGEPRPASTLETVVAVPEVEEEGIVEVTVTLLTDDVGRPMGTIDAPLSPSAGRPSGELVGTWWGAREVTCAGEPGEGEVCVPGGAFWMGDPRLDLSSAVDMDGELERLVVLSPYFLDETEVTVAAFRASGLAKRLSANGPSDDPHEAETGIADCTFTSEPGPSEDTPTNCVSWRLAASYCGSLSKVLPTEAQLEYVQSARLGRSYVWGEDAPRCGDVVFAREDDCTAEGDGPAPAGSGARDRLVLDGEEIVDLAGNVAEWSSDMWNRQDELCWGTGLFVNPACELPSGVDEAGRTIRGGHFDAIALRLRSAVRSRVFNEEFAVSALVGFRCARPSP